MINIKNCCRLCLKDELTSRNLDCRCRDPTISLIAKINLHFDVLISEDDELSTKICRECTTKLYNFIVFYDTVQHNQLQLKISMEIQKKVSQLKWEDDDCVFIKEETDDLADVTPTINSTRKRSADSTATINDTKRKKSSICKSISNNIIVKHNTNKNDKEQPENNSEKLNHSNTIQILNSSKTVKQNNETLQNKQNISSNKYSLKSNDKIINKNSNELKNTRSLLYDNSATTIQKNKTIKILSTVV